MSEPGAVPDDTTRLLDAGHPLLARGPLRGQYVRQVDESGRVRWVYRVTWGER